MESFCGGWIFSLSALLFVASFVVVLSGWIRCPFFSPFPPVSVCFLFSVPSCGARTKVLVSAWRTMRAKYLWQVLVCLFRSAQELVWIRKAFVEVPFGSIKFLCRLWNP